MSISLTSPHRLAEDVGVVSAVITELELSDIERQVLYADLAEGADHAALEDAPEAFNRVGVDGADDVLMRGMADYGMRELGMKPAIANPFVLAMTV